MNDLMAIARLKQGDWHALDVLLQHYQVHAIRVAYAIMRDRMMAEDIVQAAFVSLPRRIATFDIQQPFVPWFMRLVANDAVSALRRDARLVSDGADPTGDENWSEKVADDSSEPERILEKAQTRDELWQLLGALSPEQRAVIVLRYYAGFSHDEISSQLHVAPATIRWRLHAALKRLQGLIKGGRSTNHQAVLLKEKREIAR